MNNSKGYTLVELLIGMVILTIAIAGALSFFILQSREGFESFRLKRVDEAITLTQAIMTRDIMDAGFGVTDCEDPTDPSRCRSYMAVRIIDGTSNAPDSLYLNYSAYIGVEPVPEKATGAVDTVVKKNGVFYDMLTGYQGFLSLGASTAGFTLSDIPYHAGDINANVGAMIALTSTGSILVKDVKISDSTYAAGSITGTQNWSFVLENSMTAKYGAPAISYKWMKSAVGSEEIGGLWRNRGAEAAPWGVPLVGAEPFFQISDFQCDMQFSDGEWASVWNTTTHTPTKLKLVRAIISYQTRPRGVTKWGPVHRRTVSASPRNMVLSGD